jgi:hypothetical protein
VWNRHDHSYEREARLPYCTMRAYTMRGSHNRYEVTVSSESATDGWDEIRFLIGPSNAFSSTDLLRNTGSERTFELLQNWLEKCRPDEHPACHRNHTLLDPRLPTRLIRLVNAEHIQLVLSSTLASNCQYMTLSHCWGKRKLITLNKKSSVQLFAGIEVATLPQTFKDALFTCRRLGMDYLWIDSLCIQQDDETDWEREAATMSDVYANSYCNIAATAAHDASEGCFFDRDPVIYTPYRFELDWPILVGTHRSDIGPSPFMMFPDYLDWTDGMVSNPLMERGWVLQERLLAPRTVHYSRGQVFWECSHLVASDVFPNGQPQGLEWLLAFERWSIFGDKENQFWGKRGGGINSIGSNDTAYMSWKKIVEAYSQCALTKKQDKLVAIDGVAKILERAGCGRYCAGIWEDDFLHQMMWCAWPPGKRSSVYRAPSWSWGSIDGKILFVTPMNQRNASANAAFSCFVENHFKPVDPWGHCMPKHVHFLEAHTRSQEYLDNTAHQRWYARLEAPLIGNLKSHLALSKKNTEEMSWWYNWDEGEEGHDALDYQHGKLQVCALELGLNMYDYMYVVLMLSAVSEGEYRRVGLCYFRFEGYKNRRSIYGKLDWNYIRAQIPMSTPNIPKEYYESTRTVSDPDWVDWRDSYEWDSAETRADAMDAVESNDKASNTDKHNPADSLPKERSFDLSDPGNMELIKKHLETWMPHKASLIDTTAGGTETGSETTRKMKANATMQPHGPQGREVQLYTFTII